jgi:hypothetical protein
MTAAQVIDEIKHLPRDQQAEVVSFLFEFAKTRQLTGNELGDLAERLAASTDPAEIARLRLGMTRGFFGE